MKASKQLSLILHIAGWAIFLTLPLLLRENNGGRPPHLPPHMVPPHRTTPGSSPLFIIESFIFNLLLVPIFYLNTMYLVPKLLLKKKYGRFIGVQALNLILINTLLKLLSGVFAPDRPPMRMGIPNFVYALVVLFAICYCLIRHNLENERIQKEKETETLRSELIFLRWQISPHFMFNVLNNLVALSRVKSDKLEPMLIGLSTLLRYMVYDNNEKKVTISKELAYLQSYIDLQSTRVGTEVNISTEFVVDNENQLIEPMLLIPFVENAFKHGTGAVPDPFIHVHLKVSDQQLLFTIKNRFAPDQHTLDDSHGIGLANVQRRLDLIYGNKHTLKVSNSGDIFNVSLTINML